MQTANGGYLYKTGANLYDGNRFAPVFISLHIYWFSDNVLAGSQTMEAGHSGMNGLCHLRASVSRSADALRNHRLSAHLHSQFL